MGLADVFGKDELVELKVGELLSFFEGYARGVVKAEMLENGVKAGVPNEYMVGMLTGEPVGVEFPEPCECTCDPYWDDDEPTGEEILFEEKNMFKEAFKGFVFVLTEKGYECTPEAVKPERAVGKPVKGYEHRVPEGWLSKEYVVMVPEEGALSDGDEENTE